MSGLIVRRNPGRQAFKSLAALKVKTSLPVQMMQNISIQKKNVLVTMTMAVAIVPAEV